MSEQSSNRAVRDLVSGAGIVYTGLILEMGVAFFAQVLVARYLSLGGFGGITTGTAVLNIGAILGTLGLSEGLTRYLPRSDSEERGKIVATTLAIVVPFSALLGAACVVWAPLLAERVFGEPGITTSLRVFGAAIPFAAVLMLAIGGIRGQEKPRYRVYAKNLLQPIVRSVLVVAVLLVGASQVGFALAYAVPYVLAAALALLLLWRSLAPVRYGWLSRSRLAELLDYSLPMVLTKASSFVYRSVDIFVVLYFLSASDVGAYGVAYGAARLVLMFNMAFNFLGAPIASRLEKDEGVVGMVESHRPLIKWLTVASCAILFPFVVFPAEFIGSVYRSRYAIGAGALTVLAVGFALHNVLGAQANLLRGIGASRLLALNGVVAAVANVGLNLVLVPRYGIVGAAVATACSYWIMDTMMAAELYRETGTSIFSFEVVAPAVVALPVFGICYLLSGLVPATLLGVVLSSGLSVSVYLLAVVVVLGLSSTDVRLLRLADDRFDLPTGGLVEALARFER